MSPEAENWFGWGVASIEVKLADIAAALNRIAAAVEGMP